MEEAILSKRNRKHVEQPILIRYADDFVALHSDLEKLKQVEQKLTDWLADRGLHMNSKKTRITHTLTPYEGNVFFAREKWTNFYTKSLPTDQSIKTIFESKSKPLCNRKRGHLC